MTQNEVIENVTRTYRELLAHLENKCLDIKILNRMLENNTLFDIGDQHEFECTPYRHSFMQLAKVVQNLPAKNRAITTSRIRQIIRKTIGEWQEHQRNQDIDRWRTKMLVKEDLIRSILADLVAADASILTAGVGILVKDLEQFIAKQQEPDFKEKNHAKKFIETLEEIKQSEKKSDSPNTYEAFKNLIASPTGFAEAASQGKLDLGPLLGKTVVSKAATSAGRKFLNKFKRKLKKAICEGPGCPYEAIKNGQVSMTALPTTIATTVLTVGLSAATFWYPLAVYISLLIVKTGLETYCDKK